MIHGAPSVFLCKFVAPALIPVILAFNEVGSFLGISYSCVSSLSHILLCAKKSQTTHLFAPSLFNTSRYSPTNSGRSTHAGRLVQRPRPLGVFQQHHLGRIGPVSNYYFRLFILQAHSSFFASAAVYRFFLWCIATLSNLVRPWVSVDGCWNQFGHCRVRDRVRVGWVRRHAGSAVDSSGGQGVFDGWDH